VFCLGLWRGVDRTRNVRAGHLHLRGEFLHAHGTHHLAERDLNRQALSTALRNSRANLES
jgi:hypothetical protein